MKTRIPSIPKTVQRGTVFYVLYSVFFTYQVEQHAELLGLGTLMLLGLAPVLFILGQLKHRSPSPAVVPSASPTDFCMSMAHMMLLQTLLMVSGFGVQTVLSTPKAPEPWSHPQAFAASWMLAWLLLGMLAVRLWEHAQKDPKTTPFAFHLLGRRNTAVVFFEALSVGLSGLLIAWLIPEAALGLTQMTAEPVPMKPNILSWQVAFVLSFFLVGPAVPQIIRWSRPLVRMPLLLVMFWLALVFSALWGVHKLLHYMPVPDLPQQESIVAKSFSEPLPETGRMLGLLAWLMTWGRWVIPRLMRMKERLGPRAFFSALILSSLACVSLLVDLPRLYHLALDSHELVSFWAPSMMLLIFIWAPWDTTVMFAGFLDASHIQKTIRSAHLRHLATVLAIGTLFRLCVGPLLIWKLFICAGLGVMMFQVWMLGRGIQRA